jgi:predicted Ser/Thr protein kinase
MGETKENGGAVKHQTASGDSASLLERMQQIASDVQDAFQRDRRVLSWGEYLQVFEEHPERHCRDSASYVLSMIEHFGNERVECPTGRYVRYRLFDQPFLEASEAAAHRLVGQERVQQEVVRCLENFRREGRANRVLLLHGPNGSAKSTIASCLMSGLEHYSKCEEGALYRFHWVFPKKTSVRGAIGFSGSDKKSQKDLDSYAHLADDELDTRLVVEVRDHPLFLIPREMRQTLLGRFLGPDAHVSRWLSDGALCHKNQQIFSALLNSYEGSLADVLRHVQVERYFISKRYRVGAVTLGPALSVDAMERQVTADRNLGSLPTSLHGLSLFDVGGELVDASGGILELSDLLKRPIDAFKYLQITAETGAVSLGSQNLEINCLFLASGNELHLSALREHPEYESFRGRFTLIPVPYLRDHNQEQAIYDHQVVPRIDGYVAPHATAIAARFAVLTRLLKPIEERYEENLRPIISKMTAWTKLLAYSGELREMELFDSSVSLRQATVEMVKEWQGAHVYEGIAGVSARVMRQVLLDAALSPHFDYLSPFAVLDELDVLCEKVQDYAFLKQEPREGGFHDHHAFRQQLREWYLDVFEDELRQASGLVEQTSYEELFGRYVSHVSAFVKGEKIKNAVTGALEPPDEGLMEEVESLLGVKENRQEARAGLMGRIAAWAIDNPGKSLSDSQLFADKLGSIRAAVFGERRVQLGRLCRRLVETTADGKTSEDPQVQETLRQLKEEFGYRADAARDSAARLLTIRFSDLT